MKSMFIILITASALVLGACASIPERSATEIDSDYVGMVESHAKQAGVEIVWVNPPRRMRSENEDN